MDGWDGVSVGVGCNPTGLFYDYIFESLENFFVCVFGE